MEAQADSQGYLDNSWALGDESVAINLRVWFRDEDGIRAVFVENKPFHTYRLDDQLQHRFCGCQLVESKLAKQCEVAKAFGLSEKMLERCRRRLREGGIEALLPRKRGPKGRRKVNKTLAGRIVRLYKSGCPKLQIAARLGLSEGTIRGVLKQHGLGPGSAPPQPQLPFAQQAQELDVGHSAEGWVMADLEEGSCASLANPELVQATSIPYASPTDQLGAMLGLIEEAPVEFASARNVPMAGALLGLALLAETGLLQQARAVYGKLKDCWYGLRPLILTLFAMALVRIKRAEGLKGVDPVSLGAVLGLPRAPEVKTVRRKLKQLSLRGLAAELHRRLARRRATESQDQLAYLYVDGHVRAYSGKRKIAKAYVTTPRTVQRAETDYWVNLADGQPLLVVHAEANEKLIKIIKPILAEVRTVIGDRPAMIVFDRGGWCGKLFRLMLAEGFDLLTYRKAPFSDVAASWFHTRHLRIGGHRLEYELADGDFIQKGWPRLRRIAVKRKDGRQTHILCSRYDIDAAELAYRMFGRWKQENWFKYMGEQFALDVLVDYSTQPHDPDRMLVNPQWRNLNQQVKAALRQLREAEAAYGRARLSKSSRKQQADQAAAVEEARARYERLCGRRSDTPKRIRLAEVSDRDPLRLGYERKLLTDTIKICAYEVETRLVEMLNGQFGRHEAEGRAVIREIFQTPGDILPRDGELQVWLNQLSAPRYSEALMWLCQQLNARDLRLPETDLRLRFHVKPRLQTRHD